MKEINMASMRGGKKKKKKKNQRGGKGRK